MNTIILQCVDGRRRKDGCLAALVSVDSVECGSGNVSPLIGRLFVGEFSVSDGSVGLLCFWGSHRGSFCANGASG